jgi:hypothetical protein
VSAAFGEVFAARGGVVVVRVLSLNLEKTHYGVILLRLVDESRWNSGIDGCPWSQAGGRVPHGLEMG